jgi:hypothetical protein
MHNEQENTHLIIEQVFYVVKFKVGLNPVEIEGR